MPAPLTATSTYPHPEAARAQTGPAGPPLAAPAAPAPAAASAAALAPAGAQSDATTGAARATRPWPPAQQHVE